MTTRALMGNNPISLEYCSLSYLNQWFVHDMNYCRVFEHGTRIQQLEQLKKASIFYRVARNAPHKYDTGLGLERFEPILDVLDSVFIGEKQPVDFVNEVAALISLKYGGRSVLSLTTKFLWLKFKSPIVIYDSQAKKALRITGDDYASYYSAWQREFDNFHSQVQSVSSKLPQFHLYVVDQENGTPENIIKICDARWFHERVFDYFLWQSGI